MCVSATSPQEDAGWTSASRGARLFMSVDPVLQSQHTPVSGFKTGGERWRADQAHPHLRRLLESPRSSSSQPPAHLLGDAIRERRERYLKLSSLITSRLPQDTRETRRRKDDRKRGGGRQPDASHQSRPLPGFHRNVQETQRSSSAGKFWEVWCLRSCSSLAC